MPIVRKRDIEEKFISHSGQVHRFYPMQESWDLGFVTWSRKEAESDETCPFPYHSHPGIDEYWYIISGQGKVVIGEGVEGYEAEILEVEAGDLVITPRGIPHKVFGAVEMLCWHCKHNVWGQPAGVVHPSRAWDKPPRQNKEDYDFLPDVGEYYEMDSAEKEITYIPSKKMVPPKAGY